MKSVFFYLLLLISGTCFSQNIVIDSCGKNDTPKLNAYEAAYFNQTLSMERGSFDFTGKRVAFFAGDLGAYQTHKKEFFEKSAKPALKAGKRISNDLIILNKEEMAKAGVDAILISWSKKKISVKVRKKLVKRAAKL